MPATYPDDPIDALLTLSHDLGREDRRLAILGEGNTSVRLSDDTFAVKASGSSLPTLRREDVTVCRFAPLLGMINAGTLPDAKITDILLESRVDPASKKPSVEASFHAHLLSLPGVTFVAHTHPISVNAILCSERADDFATRPLFPDQIVCCGREMAVVPYVDPGPPLAAAIRDTVQAFRARLGEWPRVILLKNHGLIAPAASAAGALAATLMASKTADIFLGAAAIGGPIFMDDSQTRRIESRDDEAYRRKMLNL